MINRTVRATFYTSSPTIQSFFFRSVSCYPEAHSWISTPNIDRLAHEGMRFSNCYTSAWCAPSRATYLTGKLPHGVMSMHLPTTYPNYVRDPDQCPLLARESP